MHVLIKVVDKKEGDRGDCDGGSTFSGGAAFFEFTPLLNLTRPSCVSSP